MTLIPSIWRRGWLSLVLCLGIGIMPCRAVGQRVGAVAVEPAALEQRRDLIGREVIVDDRLAFYVERTGPAGDELKLKRTRVLFRVPQSARPRGPGHPPAVVVRGVLRAEGSGVVCDVVALTPMPSDLDRLERELSLISPRDFESRRAWAQWAAARARDFKDDRLRRRAQELESESLRIEADLARRTADAPARWLAMAREAKNRHAAEPEPSALAHKAIRAQLQSAGSLNEINAVLQLIAEFFPNAANDYDAARIPLDRWQQPYENDPEAAYRSASPQERHALDRRLWADAREQLLNLEPPPDIEHLQAAQAEIQKTLPEKPQLAARLLARSIDAAQQNLASLRLPQLRLLVSSLRNAGQREAAHQTASRWLRLKRDQLSRTDVEGAIALATLYDELLDDRSTSIELLRQAWDVDPKSPELEQAFRTRGYRKHQNQWVPIAPGDQTQKETRPVSASPDHGLTGLTAEEVRRKLGGNPDRINYIGTRGRMIEQWQYLDSKQVRFVNLLHMSGELKPRVVSDYTIPRSILRSRRGSPPESR